MYGHKDSFFALYSVGENGDDDLFGALMGGAVVTERIFNINGIGNFLYRSIGQKDGTSVVGTIVCLVLIYLLVNLLVDILYGFLDPRISHD